MYHKGVLWGYALSATPLCYLAYSDEWKIKTVTGLYVCMGWSCALTQLKSGMQRTWLRSNSEAECKPEGQSPGSRQGWQNAVFNTKINSESCSYHRGTSVNTVRALSQSQLPLHLFVQTGSRHLLKAEVLLRTNTQCSNSLLSPSEWCVWISSTLAAMHDPRISACLQTGRQHCHRADGIQEGEGASIACQKNIPFNVLSGLMKHLRYYWMCWFWLG